MSLQLGGRDFLTDSASCQMVGDFFFFLDQNRLYFNHSSTARPRKAMKSHTEVQESHMSFL